jgi:hypothetical protein
VYAKLIKYLFTRFGIEKETGVLPDAWWNTLSGEEREDF